MVEIEPVTHAIAQALTHFSHTSQNLPGQTKCLPVTTCTAGMLISIPATPSSNQQCVPCPAGSISTASNSVSCSLCQPELGEFQNQTAKTFCYNATHCEPGYEQGIPGTPTSDRTCIACPSNTFTDSVDSTCQYFQNCTAGFSPLVNGTSQSDRVCAECGFLMFKPLPGNGLCTPVTTCGPGTEEISTWSPTTDRVCAACNVTAGNYQPVSGQTKCLQLTICQIGEQVSVFPTPSSDRVCEPCPPGEYQPDAGQDSCIADVPCGDGKEVAVNGTTSTPTQCSCILGSTFQPGVFDNSLPCQNVSVCTGDTVLFAAATLSSDNICTQPSNIGYTVLFFPIAFGEVSGDGGAAFIAALKQSIFALFANPTFSIAVVLTPGSVYANVSVSDSNVLSAINQVVSKGSLQVPYSQGEATAQAGFCAPGSTSSNGLVPCSLCPNNTYV